MAVQETAEQLARQRSLQDEKDKKPSSAAEALKKVAASYGYDLENVSSDGNCFYHAVSDQLWRQLGVLIDPKKLRELAVDHVIKNLGLYHTAVEGSMHPFIDQMSQPGKWADAIHVMALSRALHINLAIVRSDGAAPTIHHRDKALTTVYLGYEVGRHYQSLVPQKPDTTTSLEVAMQSTAVDTQYASKPHQSIEWLKSLGLPLHYVFPRNLKDQQIKAFLTAINRGDAKAVTRYLQQGISPTAIASSFDITTPFLAAEAGHVPVMEALLAADVSKSLFSSKNKAGDTPLLKPQLGV